MNVTDIRAYLRTAPMDEVRQINQVAADRIKSERKKAKAQFGVGDLVTSDNPRWIYGTGTITGILRKYILVETSAGRFKVPATWLKHAE